MEHHPDPKTAPERGAGVRPAETEAVTRGVCRLFVALGFAPLREFTLPGGRRIDVAGLGRDGELIAAEVKSGVEDYRADRKWTDYLDYCDRFFFAVGGAFPQGLLPDDTGLIVADRFGGAIVREAPIAKLHASRRKAATLRFARIAAERATRISDPEVMETVGAGWY